MDLDPAAQPTPEQEKSKEADNARKFITEPLSPEFLAEHGATPFLLITDWTETGENGETKVVYKKFDNGDVQMFLISKATKDGKRTKDKKAITEVEYEQLLAASRSHVEKCRHEFTYTQNGTSFAVNYDEFAGGRLYMLDVDAKTEEGKDSFNLIEFPSKDFPIKLVEVTEDKQYSGHRIFDIVQTIQH
jgi:hypothetical protein